MADRGQLRPFTTQLSSTTIESFAYAHPFAIGGTLNSPHMTRIAERDARAGRFRVRVHTGMTVTDDSYTGRGVIHIGRLYCGDGAGPPVRRPSRHVVTWWRTATRRP
ncbi:hypothetical protein GCM10022295_02740 [Streptomyces osmaniensis]|uniref:Uncharacterized protein n=1 Tax=Streptomyces osmaniensis TaxID=593134 RepID=A0ABP6V0C7_9ACTN